MKEINKWVEEKYTKLYKKSVNSKVWFAIINIISFAMVASMVILNIYSIKKNPYHDTVKFYVAIAIITSFIGLLTSVTSFFTLNKSSNTYGKQYEEINKEYKLYKEKKDHYKGKDRDALIIDRVLEITKK